MVFAKCNQNQMLLSMMIMDSSAEMMLENIKVAQECGIDIAMIGFPFTPIGIDPEYLRNLCLSVLEKSPLPVSIQHINRPSSKPNEIELFKELIMHPRVILLNDCSNDLDKIDMLLDAAEERKNGLSVFTGSAFSCASYGELGYKGFLLASACFTGHIAGKILEFVQTGRAKPAQELQDYMNSLLLDVLGLDFEHYLVGQKQMMVELGVFNTAKTLQNYHVPEDLVFTIREVVEQEKEFLLPEIKPQSEE